MPGTVTEDIEIIDAGHGGGTGTPAGGDDDSGSPGAKRPVPRRAYFTALQLGLAAIVMFFMALASSYIVRKGLGVDWQSTRLPPVFGSTQRYCSQVAPPSRWRVRSSMAASEKHSNPGGG